MNCRSVLNKLSELQIILDNLAPTIVCLTETWLCPSNLMHTTNYTWYRRDRPTVENIRSTDDSRGYGGVALLVRDNVFSSVTRRTDLQRTSFEAVWLGVFPISAAPINIHIQPLIVACIYRPPSQTSSELSHFCHLRHLQNFRISAIHWKIACISCPPSLHQCF